MPFVPSVTFTLGSVMGRLFDAPLPEKVIYRCLGDETAVGFRHSLDAYFYRKRGIFYLCNVCDNDNSYLTLSAARNGELQPKTILIPGNCEYNVTGFHDLNLTLFVSIYLLYRKKDLLMKDNYLNIEYAHYDGKDVTVQIRAHFLDVKPNIAIKCEIWDEESGQMINSFIERADDNLSLIINKKCAISGSIKRRLAVKAGVPVAG